MKESKNDIAYFLSDPNFIDWVKHPTESSDAFWKKWLNDHPGDKEVLYTAKAVLERTNFKVSDISKNRKDEILENILENKTSSYYKHEKLTQSRAINFYPWLMGSAAIFFLILASKFFYNNWVSGASNSETPIYMMVEQAEKGKRNSFYLPDSTMVTLNTESKLTYPSQFDGNMREVTLIGEAYFDVRHDTQKKFRITSGDVVTIVHGTAFNIRAYMESAISVSLERGSLSVCSKTDINKENSYQLMPGEKLTVNKDFGKSEKSDFNFEEEFGWKEGILVFKDADLKTFVKTIERWYDVQVTIVGKTDENWAMNGKFKNKSLENVLKSLEFSRGVAYKINDKQVTLYNNNY